MKHKQAGTEITGNGEAVTALAKTALTLVGLAALLLLAACGTAETVNPETPAKTPPIQPTATEIVADDVDSEIENEPPDPAEAPTVSQAATAEAQVFFPSEDFNETDTARLSPLGIEAEDASKFTLNGKTYYLVIDPDCKFSVVARLDNTWNIIPAVGSRSPKGIIYSVTLENGTSFSFERQSILSGSLFKE